MTLDDALKWADAFGPIQSDPPTGDAPALMVLAAEVRRLSRELEQAKQDDPKLLRARIAELQREIGAATKQQPDPKEDLKNLLASARQGGLLDGYDKALHDISGETSIGRCKEHLQAALDALNQLVQVLLHSKADLAETAKLTKKYSRNIS